MNLMKNVADRTPIVIVSTQRSLEMIQTALRAGANDYIHKPITPEDVREKLSLFIESQS